MKKFLAKRSNFCPTAMLLDLISAELILASLTLIFAGKRSFTELSFVLDIPPIPFFLYLTLLFFSLSILRLITRSSVFSFLPGLSACGYLILTLREYPPISYCIGLLLSLAAAVYICLPFYSGGWRRGAKLERALVIMQSVLLAATVILAAAKLGYGLQFEFSAHSHFNLFIVLLKVVCILLFAGALYAVGRIFARPTRLTERSVKRITTVLALLFFFFLSLPMIARTFALLTPTYDFGLFSQMYHYMATTGKALTTLERTGLLSHFAVHISPIFYVLLPFYLLFPRPETLEVLQVLVAISGVFPLLLLCRRFSLKYVYRVVLIFLYLFHPGIIGSCLYDLHENCFLAPLILWLLYFLETGKKLPIALTALLLLGVKEDAAVYVAVIGLYTAVSGRQKRAGFILTVVSVIYFGAAVYFLNRFGEGAMFGRYDNLLANESWGLFGIIPTMLINPGYFLNEIFLPDKLSYLFTALASLGFLPLLQRKYARLLLLIPLLVINLMPDYSYQHIFGFQYHFGTTVLMLYLMIRFLADLPGSTSAASELTGFKKACVATALCTAVIGCTFFSSELLLPEYYSVGYLGNNTGVIESIKHELDKIPRDANIQASTLFTTYLSDRNIVYDIKYNQEKARPYITDYIVLDQRPEFGYLYQRNRDYIEAFLSDNYTVLTEIKDQLIILQRQDP